MKSGKMLIYNNNNSLLYDNKLFKKYVYVSEISIDIIMTILIKKQILIH